MKIRYVFLTFTIFTLLLFGYTYQYIDSDSYTSVDVVEINRRFKQVEKILKNRDDSNENGQRTSSEINKELEKEYGCTIILVEDKAYESTINSGIQNGDIIIDYFESDMIIGKIIFQGQSANFNILCNRLIRTVYFSFGIMFIICIIFFLYIYIRYLRPFHKLQNFAVNISQGNLDIPLHMNKDNYFGAFTESFDIMREELKCAREGEYLANMSKKELVASLSHDIKTPVSTIKALCEILEIKEKVPDTLEKVKIINQKADMIDNLISNMFHASLEELAALKIEPREELSTIIPQMFEESNHYKKIHCANKIPECLLYVDKLRLNQVVDNVINNSYKYANTDILVTYIEEKNGITIQIRDFGIGVLQEELPLITEKYYRGNNAEGHHGSGLGLYLSSVFMKGMKGSLECSNDNGFVVTLYLMRV